MKNILFPIPIMGEGSGDIEAFPSYIQRAAFHHGISSRLFLKHVEAVANHISPDVKQKFTVPKSFNCSTFLRPTLNNMVLIRKLEQFTNNKNMKKTLFWWLKHSSQRTRKGLYSTSLRWCSECFHEMDLIEQERYIKLIWLFGEVNTCFKHNLPIIQHCPTCNLRQVSSKNRFAIGFCSECGEDLSLAQSISKIRAYHEMGNTCCNHMEGNSIAKDDWYETAKRNCFFGDKESWKWLNQGVDIQKLIADIANETSVKISEKSALVGLMNLANMFPPDSTSHHLILFHTDQIKRKGFGSLQMIRKLAYEAGITLYDLLSGNTHQMSFLSENGGACSFRPSFFEKNKRINRDHKKVARVINEKIINSYPPLSLNQVAQISNVSTGYIEYRFPDLASKAVDKHQSYIEFKKLADTLKAISMALQLKTEMPERAISKRFLYRQLRQGTDISKSNILSALDLL